MSDVGGKARRKELIDLLIETADERTLGFTDAVVMSGIGARQLRNGLDRDTLQVGRRLPSVGRWTFSFRECFYLMIVGELTSRAWTPIGSASSIARQITSSFDHWAHDTLEMIETRSARSLFNVIAFAEDGAPRVLIVRSGDRRGVYELTGEKVDTFKIEELNEAHLCIPVVGLMSRLVNGYIAARLEDPETLVDEKAAAGARARDGSDTELR